MQRDASIDILKCVAVIVVLNSHMDLLYGKYAALATGGAIGDALFFFCSGFTLFLGRNAGFFDWYKKRINRIYPTVFASIILACLLEKGGWEHRGLTDVLVSGGGWFITCIMIYYAILWFVKTYAVNCLRVVFGLAFACVLLWYFVVGIDSSNNNMYGACHFKWVHNFIYILLGAVIGLKKVKTKKGESRVPSFGVTIIKLMVCVIVFYGLCWFKNKDGIYDYVQMMSIAPLMGVIYYFYELCNTERAVKAYNSKISGLVIRFVGGLCLEIYLIQGMIFSDVLNFMFPLNVPIFFVIIVAAAYMLRCFARIWSQTFKDVDYDWKAVVKLY